MKSQVVSVVLAVFNAERFVSLALSSVLRQTYDKLEVIDDGSTASSLELLADQAASDRRISIIRTPNCGVAAARNVALTKARGDLMAVMDADDVCELTRFEKQVSYLVN